MTDARSRPKRRARAPWSLRGPSVLLVLCSVALVVAQVRAYLADDCARERVFCDGMESVAQAWFGDTIVASVLLLPVAWGLWNARTWAWALSLGIFAFAVLWTVNLSLTAIGAGLGSWLLLGSSALSLLCIITLVGGPTRRRVLDSGRSRAAD